MYITKKYAYTIFRFFTIIMPLIVLGLSSCNEAPSNFMDTSYEESEQPFDALIESEMSHGKVANAIVSDKKFKVFNEIRHFDAPNMKRLGFTPIEGIYTWNLWGERSGQIPQSLLPIQSKLKEQARLARKTNPNIAVLDIEHWPTTGVSLSTLRESISKYVKVYKRFKVENPKMKIGFYGVVPERLASDNPKREVFFKWRRSNKRLQSLANRVDVFYVSAKTHWKDYQAWARSLKLNIYQARRMANGKPVYVVLDPQYPRKVYGASSKIHNRYIEADYWEWQLSQARRFADGIVIWSHYGRKWDPSAPWWNATKRFLRELGKTR